jgi:hydrogenase expression/formation protein HypC
MCLAVPARLSECKGGEAIAEMQGNRIRVSTVLVPEAVDGDWVLVHAGFAIQRLEAGEAEQTFAVLEEVDEAAKESL